MGSCQVASADPLLRGAAAAADLIQQDPGRTQASALEEREAADGFCGIQLAAHQELKALARYAQLLRDHGDHGIQPAPQQRIGEVGAGFCQASDAIALGHG